MLPLMLVVLSLKILTFLCSGTAVRNFFVIALLAEQNVAVILISCTKKMFVECLGEQAKWGVPWRYFF